MGTFIEDGAVVLPPVKSDARPASGAPTEWAAADSNEVRSALLDLRTAAVGVQTGFVNPNTALVTSNGSPGATKALQPYANLRLDTEADTDLIFKVVITINTPGTFFEIGNPVVY